MLRAYLARRYLKRLRAPASPAERQQAESVLASARVFLASSALIAIYLDPTAPTIYNDIAYGLLIEYLVYSVLVLALLPWRELPFVPLIFAVDVIFPSVFIFFTQGANSPFFLFFVFVLMSAAYRWGFPETVGTAGLVTLLMIFEGYLLSHAPARWDLQLQPEYELNRIIIRSAYFMILGLLVGYLAEQEKLVRAETAVITRVLAQARLEKGVRGTLQALFSEALEIFGGGRGLAIVEQRATGRVFLWHSEYRGQESSLRLSEPSPEERVRYLVSSPAHSFYAERYRAGWRVCGIDGDGLRVPIPEAWPAEGTAELHGAFSVLSVSFALGEEWLGRFLLYDCTPGVERLKEVRFAQRLMNQLGPVLYTVYLLQRLRSRAGAMERARVARELHDGAIQALISVEMQVDVLRRQAGKIADGTFSERLMAIQDLLRQQIFNLRDLMQQMKPVELKPGELLDYLADMVDRFRRDTGIAAQFVSELDEVMLPPGVSREMARIVQEALVNIRKHSNAQHVLVRFASYRGTWKLRIEDDGRGFDFSGHMSLKDLDNTHKGPQTIKERVRTLGGDLSIESLPGKGATLEITVPQKAALTYA